MSHTVTYRVFLSATRLLALLETFAGVPDRQVDTLGGRGLVDYLILLCFFSQASTMEEAITNDSSTNKLDIPWCIALVA